MINDDENSLQSYTFYTVYSIIFGKYRLMLGSMNTFVIAEAREIKNMALYPVSKKFQALTIQFLAFPYFISIFQIININ